MNTNTMRSGLKAALIAAALLGTSSVASAHDHWHGHVGIWFGGPFWGPYYYPPYYYYPPTVVAVPTEPPVYVERQDYAPAGEPEGFWYYCPASKTYYPYVKNCAEPWRQVTPVPPKQ